MIKVFQYIPDVLPFNLVHIDHILLQILVINATTCLLIRSCSSSFDVSSAAIVFGVLKKGGFSVDIRPGRMHKIHI